MPEFKNKTSLLLDGIVNLDNFGLICRTAESLNIKNIYLFNPGIDLEHKKLKRVSRSTDSKLGITALSLSDLTHLAEVKPFVGIEITENSKLLYSEVEFPTSAVLVGGSERNGISPEILALCKSCFYLPIVGTQSSINLACAMSSAMHWVTYLQLV